MPQFTKRQLSHASLYISCLTRSRELPYLLFIHGGPGLNSGVLEQLIEKQAIYSNLQANLVLYDQRECGRSSRTTDTVTHRDNIKDVQNVLDTLAANHIDIKAIIGHSYGAKLLADFLITRQCSLPAIFIATAASILTPRINNLLLDLTYLKKIDQGQYMALYEKFENMDYASLWELSETLAPLFQKNPDRALSYWANLTTMRQVDDLKTTLNLPINPRVFKSVRADLYRSPDNFKLHIDQLKQPTLWINGFHDKIMDGASAMVNQQRSPMLFNQSAHYPHLEQPTLFASKVNAFLASL